MSREMIDHKSGDVQRRSPLSSKSTFQCLPVIMELNPVNIFILLSGTDTDAAESPWAETLHQHHHHKRVSSGLI